MAFDLSSALQKTIRSLGPLPSPTSGFAAKRGLSQALSDNMAEDLAAALNATFPGITAGGTGKATLAATSLGFKSYDVQWTVTGRGLAFGISVKNVGAPEQVKPTTRNPLGYTHYTHNYKRVSEEWSLETLASHRFQPFATLVGVLFLPADSMYDRPVVPSLHAAVEKFKDFAQRENERDYAELLEAIYIGVYINSGPNLGLVRFWDVAAPLPRGTLPDPSYLYTLEQLVPIWRQWVLQRYKKLPLP